MSATGAGGPIHVSMAADAGFTVPLWVAVTSLARRHRPGDCTVLVVHSGIDARFRAELAREVGDRLVVTFREAPRDLVDGAHFSTFLSGASLYRLLLPRLVGDDITRTIYLDADTVTVTDLRELWEQDLGHCLAAAVREAGSPWPVGPLGTDWRSLGMAPGSAYLNSGMLVIPLDAWRREDVASQILALLRRTRPRWGDQDGINAVLEGRWLELHRRWNLQSADVDGRGIAWALWRDEVEEAVRNPAVVHFTERDKPWVPGGRHPLTALWWENLDETSRRGWRPAARARPLYRRVGGRARRAARLLLTGSA